MTRFDEDRELDEFLARRSALHRRLAEPDHTEPPPELDRLVLNEAREAINVPANVPVYRAPRWALPVSLAATVVLALAIVVNFGRMQQGARPVASSVSPAVSAASPAADATAVTLPPAAPLLPPDAQQLSKRAESFAAAPTPARVQRPGPPLAASAEARVMLRPNEARIVAPAKRETAFGTAAVESVEAGAQPRARTELTSSSPLTTADAAIVTPTAPAAASEKAKHADPRAWLREIERLRAVGRGADAERELAEFRKAFPSEPVPAAARDPRPSR